ncbi:leucine-rich repeat domain-containing protein, partial [uncultured Imperialibacter sp.]|uniref:leucine-rich repeat domain-containing protein n=1 Tax=uncultured Imperialibacter sp. TaxID=1672639 RepID=UPI0030D75150
MRSKFSIEMGESNWRTAIANTRKDTIKFLNLSHCQTDSLGIILTAYPHITGLSLSSTLFNPDDLAGIHLDSLRRLDLSGNRLREIPAFVYQLKRLESLDLRSNFIDRLPGKLRKLKELEVVDLSYNRLDSLGLTAGWNWQISKVYLNQNNLDEVPRQINRLRR